MNRRDLLTGRKPVKSASQGAEFYTNALLVTHEGEKVRFYDDLIKDKLVIINHIYTQCEGTCPIATANLVRVQRLLGERVGRDVHMYTLTLKPWEDDVDALKAYAEAHGVRPGWKFLTGDDHDLTTIRFRLSRWDHLGIDFNIEQHTGMVRIINDPINRWTMYPANGRPELIVDAVGWAEATKPYEIRLKENREKQARINAEYATS